jgi:hypothetical protein
LKFNLDQIVGGEIRVDDASAAKKNQHMNQSQSTEGMTPRSRSGHILLSVSLSLSDRRGQGPGYGVRVPRLPRRRCQRGGDFAILEVDTAHGSQWHV